ncbi:Auxin-responsive protein SAUR67 [Forsythia ovata]|uniref:Auxin-responsive protein SAUR67 n=1 Tax=Forsythia ovata TaxID=205694 RepID=A0ABD1PZE5_9LAMI
MARKWQKFAAIRRKRISFPRHNDNVDVESCSTSSVIEKGHFVVYTADKKRFVIPLTFLKSEVFGELLKMSEEEYGLPSDRPITVPCDALFMDYIILLIQRGRAGSLHEALLMPVDKSHCSLSSSHQGLMNQQLIEMISAMKLTKMARKWHKFATIRRSLESCSTSSVVERGHFVVYTCDPRRFVIPLDYLKNDAFRELLKISEEEYGLPSDGPITVPCKALFLDYILLLIRQGRALDLIEALPILVGTRRCLSSSLHEEQINQQLLVF